MMNGQKNIKLGAELLHADRQSDIKTLTVAFRNFANALNKGILPSTSKQI